MDRRLLMCRPDYFEVVYKINPWMDTSQPVDKETAIKQWQELVNIYQDLGLKIDFLEPIPGLPDMVFTANGCLVMNNKALISHFRYPQRQEEAKYHAQWCKKKGYQVTNTDGINYEGEGDSFIVGETIFQGWGFRTDYKISGKLKELFPEKEVILLKLVDPKFYHLDTCFFPVNSELVFYYSQAFDEQSKQIIKNSFKQAISVSTEEALSFCLNSVVIKETMVINSMAKTFIDRVKSMGFKVITAQLGEFAKSGGSVKCVTNEIWESK